MRYDGLSELLKAAPKRLADARELLERPSLNPHTSDAGYRHLCGAYYFAGYAVECALKAYIILLLDSRRSERVSRWYQVVESLAALPGGTNLGGKHSHDLSRLLAVSELEGAVDRDEQAKRTWGTCSKWDYNVRYRPDHMLERTRVAEFVEACSATYHWVRARLPFS
jgi:hypothetical protein